MNLEIIYEDEKILVVNKPYGVVVNRAESIKGETVQDWIEGRSQFTDNSSQITDKLFLGRSGVCHRLDKETSGCLLIAKNPESLRYYLALFKDRKIEKKYITLVHGRVEPKEGEVVLPLKRSILEREKWRVRYDGKKAITLWKVKKYFKYVSENQNWKNELTLLDIGLKTGRTHQIRVHMSFLGWPIFSDEKYLNYKQSVLDRKLLNRHFLHSYYLSFVDEKGEVKIIESALPTDCHSLLSMLEEVV